MFKNEFQGGSALEILTIQAKDLTTKCKLLGSSLNGGQRDFDKTIKSYILTLEGESTRTKLVIPKDDKQSLCILQPYLIIQLWVASGASFSLEAMISDSSNQKRRILMSTNYKDVSVTSFHVKIPLTLLKRGLWLNLCLDLKSIVADSFKGITFKSLESITVCANCKLRRVFTMKAQPKDDFDIHPDEQYIEFDQIPRSMQFPATSDCHHATQVLNMVQLEAANIKFRAGSGTGPRNSSSADQQRLDRSQRTHIAFGSRVAIPKHASRSGSQPVGIERQTSSASLSSSSGLALNMSHSDLNESTSSIPQVEVQKPILQPRPPKPASGKALRRPNPRIRSAESASLVKRAKLKIEADGVRYESTMDQSEVIDKSTAKNRSLDDADRETDKTLHGKLDENNNANVSNGKKNVDTTVRSMSQKMIGMRMGSQEDEDEYFRTRHDSESHEETSRSKDGSFSSTAESDTFFLYSSRPRSITNNSRSRLNSDSNSKTNGVPDVVVEKISPSEVNVFASLESDFHKESSDSEGEDPITRMHKLGGNRRNSPSPILVDRQGENGKERIRGSLLKEISPPAANRYDHLKYQSVQSDSMSWMYDSDSSQVVSHNISDHSFKQQSSPIKVDNDKSPRIGRLRVLDAFSVGNEHGSDSEDVLSDDSDATSYSTWKEPPPHIRNYRYQEEMRGVGMTLDLSTTLPMTPYIEEQSPIKERTLDNVDGELSFAESEKMDPTKSQDMEGELDLLYDPVLNCYYDPKTHKYYELA